MRRPIPGLNYEKAKAASSKIVTHRVVLTIIRDSDDKPMTEKQAKKWVEDHFQGGDYGIVKVLDVINAES